MQRVNIDGIIKKIKACVDRHNLGSYGDYSRWTWGERNLGRNEYGCADAANILYTIGAFPQSEAERRGFIEKMQKMQNLVVIEQILPKYEIKIYLQIQKKFLILEQINHLTCDNLLNQLKLIK